MNKMKIMQFPTLMRRSLFTFSFTVIIVLISICILPVDVSYAKVKLKNNEPAMCYKCHTELKGSLADRYTHFLFRGGKCSSCHNPHVSKERGLINEDINPLCLGCHDGIQKIIKNSRQHSAVRDGVCTDCHFPHSSNNRHLLVKPEKDLCWKCHEDLKPQLDKKFACLPFKNGECSACHNAHGSLQENLLVDAPREVCIKCHTVIKCKSDDVSIASVTKNMNCITCHSGHSSNIKGLLGPYGHKIFIGKECNKCHDPFADGKKVTTKVKGDRLCLDCHKKDTNIIDNDVHGRDNDNSCIMCHDFHASEKSNFTVNESRLCVSCHKDTDKRTVFMEKALKSKRECAPIKNRECFECHIPRHSDRPLNFKEDVFVLCNKCHETEHKITHPLGPDVIDVRNGQPITCITCHSMHSARAKYMLTHDGKRTLCIQCHKY